MIITSSKCRPRNNAERFWFTVSPYQIRLSAFQQIHLKNVFKSAATHVRTSTDPLGDFYRSLLAKGMKPTMARLTLARKMAAIVLSIWKKGARFDPGELKQQAA